MDVTVFYAWQSDRPDKVNRFLIRDAAEDACERISKDDANDWNVNLDSDTKGVAGMCDIPNTILMKIRSCDIFLGDLTIVGKTEKSPPKLLPNTNVVLELGYAARHLTFDALVGVMNEAFGDVEGQVFDIKRRDCLTYELSDEATKNQRDKAKKSLSKQLEEVFRATIETVVLPRQAKKEEAKDNSAAIVQRDFAAKVTAGKFDKFNLLPAVLTSVQFQPVLQQDYNIAFDTVRDVLSVNPKMTGDGIVSRLKFDTILLSLDGWLLRADGVAHPSMLNSLSFYARGETTCSEDEPRQLFDRLIQTNIVKHVHENCQLIHRLGIDPPWQIGISLVGVKGFNLVKDDHFGTEPCEDDFDLPLVKVESVAEVKNVPATAMLLKDSLDRLCRQFGEVSSEQFTTAGVWNVRSLG
jgi:hypothetical protein